MYNLEDQQLVATIIFYSGSQEEITETLDRLYEVWPDCAAGMQGYQEELTGMFITTVTITRSTNRPRQP